MPTTLSTKAIDRGTFIITAAFTDEDDSPVSPNSGLTWTLSNEKGKIINSRLDVAIASSASVDIVLSGDDLKKKDGATRILLVEGTYDSNAGNDLPIHDECKFYITNLVNK